MVVILADPQAVCSDQHNGKGYGKNESIEHAHKYQDLYRLANDDKDER